MLPEARRSDVDDASRHKGKRYPRIQSLLLVWAGLLCGQKNLNLIAKWGQKLSGEFLKILGFERGVAPGKSALYDLFKSLDPEIPSTFGRLGGVSMS